MTFLELYAKDRGYQFSVQRKEYPAPRWSLKRKGDITRELELYPLGNALIINGMAYFDKGKKDILKVKL